MQINYLRALLQKDEVSSNPKLSRDLNVLMKANEYARGILSSYPTEISSDTYKYLIENHDLDLISFFYVILTSELTDEHDKLLDLALSYKIDFSNPTILSSYISSEKDLEKCLKHGLSLNNAAKMVLSNSDISLINTQENLIKYLGDKGANFNQVHLLPQYFKIETYKYMLDHGLDHHTLFKIAINLEHQEMHDQLLDLVLSYGINLNVPIYYKFTDLSEKGLEKCLKHGLKLETVAKNIIMNLINTNYPKNNNTELTLKEIEILKTVNINHIFTNILYETGIEIRNLTVESILEYLIKDLSLSSDIVLTYGIIHNSTNIVKLALQYNPDINCKYLDENFNILTYSLLSQNIHTVNLLLDLGAKLEVDTEYYWNSIAMANFDFATQVVKSISHLYTDQEIYESIRADGRSEAYLRNFFDFYNLIREYNDAISGKASSLSKFELDLLGGNITFNDISEDKNITLTNKYSYNLLHLSILSDQHSLATQLVQDEAYINAKTNNNITAIQLLLYKTQFDLSGLIEPIFDRTENIDIDLGSGETLADILITDENLRDRALEVTKDPLFTLFKNDADLLSVAKDLNKTNIAISHENGFWSTGIWSTARMINKNYPDIKLYLVNNDMLEKGGEAFIRQFDAIINPGARDSYPKLYEFTKSDCPFDMELERHYQNMLEISDQNNIPYLGICAGAQHFSMYHGGTLKPLTGYNKGRHEIKYIEGTHSHFMALTKAQQSDLLKTCHFPEVSFQGDTAHNYAAVNERLGNDLQLGAVSEDNIAMSYYHNNGIRYATQFHPEHYYNRIDDQNAIHQDAWINNFVELAKMHHDFRVNGGDHPIQIFSDISTRLTECLTNQICFAEDSVASYYDLYN